MSTASVDGTKPEFVYPERDGKPMSDNTRQFRWIHILYANLCALFAERDDVFVAGDLLWYPLERNADERAAPDVMVVFGRPRGDRGSYVQCLEGDVPPTVVFEILSPGNTAEEMIAKQLFYDQYGVEEYYVYDPDANKLEVYVRGQSTFRRVRPAQGFTSPRLGIRFELTQPEMTVFRPDGGRFLYFEELQAERRRQEQIAEQERLRAEQAEVFAQQERLRAEQAETLADEQRRIADEQRRLARRVAELSRKARQGSATPEELAELDRLEAE